MFPAFFVWPLPCLSFLRLCRRILCPLSCASPGALALVRPETSGEPSLRSRLRVANAKGQARQARDLDVSVVVLFIVASLICLSYQTDNSKRHNWTPVQSQITKDSFLIITLNASWSSNMYILFFFTFFLSSASFHFGSCPSATFGLVLATFGQDSKC